MDINLYVFEAVVPGIKSLFSNPPPPPPPFLYIFTDILLLHPLSNPISSSSNISPLYFYVRRSQIGIRVLGEEGGMGGGGGGCRVNDVFIC